MCLDELRKLFPVCCPGLSLFGEAAGPEFARVCRAPKSASAPTRIESLGLTDDKSFLRQTGRN